MKWSFYLIIFVISQTSAQVNNSLYSTKTGNVSFHSDARLENIKASSDKLNGLLNIENRNFAWALSIVSFDGFNIAIQKEHFNENYLESDRYPVASFSGKIVEDIDINRKGTFEIRAKGILNIHGVEQERIIKVSLTIKDGYISVFSKFTVLLKDHDIKVPKIVHEKVASEVLIEVKADLKH